MITVEIPHYKLTLEFPDGTTDEQIKDVLAKQDRTLKRDFLTRELGIAQQERERGTFIERAYNAAMAVPQGAEQVVGDLLKGLAGWHPVQPYAMQLPSDLEDEFRKPINERQLYLEGKAIQRDAEARFPTDERFKGEFLSDVVPRALGQSVALMATAPATGGIPGMALTGAITAGVQGYDEAIANGADEETANESFFWNALGGATEAAPLGRILNRINSTTGGSVKKALIEIGKSAFEEGSQEMGQQALSNLVAKKLYDDERPILDSVLQSGAAGALVGMLIPAAGISVRQLGRKVAGYGPATGLPPMASPPSNLSTQQTPLPAASAAAAQPTQVNPGTPVENVKEATALTPIDLGFTGEPADPDAAVLAALNPSDADVQQAQVQAQQPQSQPAQQQTSQPQPAPATPAAPATAPLTPVPLAAPGQQTGITPLAIGILPGDWWTNLQQFLSRTATKEEGLPEEAYGSWRKHEGFIAEQGKKIQKASQDLQLAILKAYGLGQFNFASAVPSVQGLLQRIWAASPTSAMRRVPHADIRMMNEALRDPGAPGSPSSALSALPTEIQGPLLAMRQHVENLSSYMINSGLVKGRLKATIARNLYTYLNRSYRVFDDPQWVWDKIPQPIRDDAITLAQRALGGVSPLEAENHLRALMEDWRADAGAGFLKTGRIGKKDLTIFMQRKELAPEIRALMGEYEDPFINYIKTISKMAKFIADQEFLTDVRRLGMGRWFFSSADLTRPTTHNTLIAAQGSSVMSPLNGLRTTPFMAQALEEFGRAQRESSDLLRLYYAINGWTKEAKTVWSLMTQARNLFGQPLMLLAGGHYHIGHVPGAMRSIAASIGALDDATYQAQVERYARLGILGENPMVNEVREMFKAAQELRSDQAVSPFDFAQAFILKRAVGKGREFIQSLYQASDEFGKIIAFEDELTRIRRDNPTMPIEQAEVAAAERTRNTMPTYSNAPRWVRAWRKMPIGPFATFWYESFRTIGWNIYYMQEDARAGNKRSAIERFAGLSLALGIFGYGLQTLSRWIWGITQDEDRDSRQMSPDHERDSSRFYTGKGYGWLSYINLSYINPYKQFTDAVFSAVSSVQGKENWQDAMLKALYRGVGPLLSEQILAGALLDIWRNKTTRGGNDRKVYNEQDSGIRQLMAMGEHIFQAITPGTMQRAKDRWIDAYKGNSPQTLPAELVGEVTGFRNQKVDFREQLKYKSQQFDQNLAESVGIFSKWLRRRKSASKDEIVDGYAAEEAARWRLFNEMYVNVNVLRRLGVGDSEIIKTMVQNGVGRDVSVAIVNGKYIPYQLSDDLKSAARSNKREIPWSEINAIYNARKGIPLTGR